MDATLGSNKKIKFHCSYGGEIILCKHDGKLRYSGGTHEVIAVDRRISYNELIFKLWDACVESMKLRCKLPGEDLNVLIEVQSDEDLNNVVEEYDAYGNSMKIRAILDEHIHQWWI
ncbi:PB1 domain-containing protein [Artemisia annua]|uniref:PB1 domain-containing protein n=1 Tax=Artemisia annua TaxID=35608 RepID=A0A2U1QF30_ARTAN|nr:PB1 domain-containing protein [Artemisia annua]PWA96629.1 PB1 domain-containing protein [Artemisia annua]